MDEPAKNEAPPAFEPTDRIEQFLIGLIAFVKHFLCTLRDIAFNKARFSRVLKGQDKDTKYARPITFITLVSFVALRIFRFGVLTLLLAFGTPSCQAETTTETIYPSFWDELRIPSVTEIILYGIPTLIVVILISQFLKFVLLKKHTDSGGALLSLTYYAVGFQYIAYLFLFSAISLLVYLEPPEEFFYAIPVVALLFLLWVVLVYYRLVGKVIEEAQFRVRRRGWRQIWLFLWSVVLIAATSLSGWGMSYSLARLEVDERSAKPILKLGMIGFDQSAAAEISMDLLVRNNSEQEIALRTEEVYAYGNLRHQGRIVANCQGETPVILLEAKEVCWARMVFSKEGAEIERGFISVSLADLIEFNAILPNGESKIVRAYILAGETQFIIRELE
jgi:hypothetical protein